MRTIKVLAALAAFVLLASPALANQGKSHATDSSFPVKKYLTNVALNGSAASRTFSITNLKGQWAQAVVYLNYSHANNGTLTLTCTAGTGAVDDFIPAVCTGAGSGTCTLTDAGVWVTDSLSADYKVVFPIGLLGVVEQSCTVEHSGSPSASDLVTLSIKVVAQ